MKITKVFIFRRALSSNRNSTLNILLGLVTGFLIMFWVGNYRNYDFLLKTSPFSKRHRDSSAINEVINDPSFLHQQLDNSVKRRMKNIKEIKFEDTHAHQDDDSIAKDMHNKVRVLCWVMTSSENLNRRAVHVKKTWAKRCNKMIFFSSNTNRTFPTIGLNISEGRQHLTAKTLKAFHYIYEKHFDEADWFMKADDDTYVILENLRYFLSEQDTNQPIYFAHHFKSIVKKQFYCGGAGYILSKEALKRFVLNSRNASICRQDGGTEDVELVHCMEHLGIMAKNSADSLGRSRIHCFGADILLSGNYPKWYYKYDANATGKRIDAISDYAISFHYVRPHQMYGLEFFVYHMQPYGIKFGVQYIN